MNWILEKSSNNFTPSNHNEVFLWKKKSLVALYPYENENENEISWSFYW